MTPLSKLTIIQLAVFQIFEITFILMIERGLWLKWWQQYVV